MSKEKIRQVKKKKTEYSLNHPFDVAISFDTTGSMKNFLTAVKSGSHDIVNDVLGQIPDVRMAVSTYLTLY